MKHCLLITIILFALFLPAISSRSSNSQYLTEGAIEPLGNENFFANFTASLFNLKFESLYVFSAQCNISFPSFSPNALKLNVSSIFFALYNDSIGSSNLYLLDTLSVYPNQIFVPGQSFQFNISFNGSITQPKLSKGYYLFLNFDLAFLLSNQSSWIPVSSHNNLFTFPIPTSGSLISSISSNDVTSPFNFFFFFFALIPLPFLKRKV